MARLAAAGVLLVGATSAAAPAASAAAAAPAPGGEAAILAQQSAVVNAEYAPEIASDQRALDAAHAALSAAQTQKADDQAQASAAASEVSADTSEVSTDALLLGRDTASLDAARSLVVIDSERVRAVAIGLYVNRSGTPPGLLGQDLAGSQAELFASQTLVIGEDMVIRQFHRDLATEHADAAAVSSDTTRLAAARTVLAQARRLQTQRAQVLAAATAAVASAVAAVTRQQNVLGTDQATLATALSALNNPPGTPNDGSPSILGGAAVDAAQLAGWYRSSGYVDFTSAPINQLAGWYLSEGAAEGVRGDVAFAQAMVETGGFASPDAIAFDNFAGIGHCDSCGSGIPFGSPQLGVRAQMQLLHSFADASLTVAQLGRPLVDPVLTPQSQPDRGCCPTWQSLTGKWATDPIYGQTLLAMYQQILSFALAHPGAGAAAAPPLPRGVTAP
ncbi:MAG: glucosaminidase domain-containing protein [Acidimicrobiales bacterium]